jgi:aminopeptidase N
MRILIAALMLFSIQTFSQQTEEICKHIEENAQRERLNYERLFNTENVSLASENFDITYYRCEWEVDPEIRYITGKVTVYFRITMPTNSISFDLMNDLVVDSIKQRNSILGKQHLNNELQVHFPASVSTGVFDSLTIYYKGVPSNSSFGSFVQSSHAGVPVIWTLSEPYGSRDWWPCKNGLTDKPDSIDILITNPAAYRAASNGLLQSETLISSGTKRLTHWKHRYPIATYLVCFAVTNYVVLNHSVQLGSTTLPMQTHCYPENQAIFQTNTQMVLNALQLFHNLFGEYPFIKEKYGHVQFGWGGGMEHQTASFIVSPSEGLMAHELAHQWFGNKITCGSWEDIWLNEGFATHLTSIYMEQKYPASIINTRRSEILSITSQPGGSVWVDDTTNVNRIFSGRLSYTKGSHLLYMLRWILGDSVFFRAARKYLNDPKLAYGFARTEDLKRHLEKESGKNLTKFFNDWYKGQGYPSYNVQWTQLGSNHVRVKMNQVTSHASVSFFELPVALTFRNATQQKTVVVDNKYNGEIFIRNIGFLADTVLIDPEYWLITRNNSTQKTQDNVSGQNIIQVFPNPVREQFYVYLRNFPVTGGFINLFNAAGQKVYSKRINIQNGSEFLEIQSMHLASGIYMLQVQTDNGVKVTKKLVK